MSFPFLNPPYIWRGLFTPIAGGFHEPAERRSDKIWIRDRDSLGNTVDHRLIEAAHRIWERARLVVIRYLAEDTEAPEILEGRR